LQWRIENVAAIGKCLLVLSYFDIIGMKGKQQKILLAIFANPVNGNIEWEKIEALLLYLGCQRLQGKGSSVVYERDGLRAYFHRPHPGKAALRYRVLDARSFLKSLGVTP
jgi:hypothetical protein